MGLFVWYFGTRRKYPDVAHHTILMGPRYRELIGEIATSAFAGLITFWLCEAAQFNPLVTAALVGISGHMGSQAIYQLERWAQSRLGKERP